MTPFASNVIVLCMIVFAKTVRAQCTTGGVVTCFPATSLPKLDGNFSDWAAVAGYSTPLFTYFGNEYTQGQATLKCVHDDEKVYFAFEFPGKYRFEGGVLTPAIATMTKIGSKASFVNMGGCPAGLSPCDSTLPMPSSCDNFVVDIGAHWETPDTKQGVEYPISVQGTGNDLVANKDDEYAVGPFCRRDDDGAKAGNEWAGAWTHSDNSTAGANGFYRFELSRLLTTGSSLTDAQYVIGKNFSFGVAFWDPWETDAGWTESGHYITGCSTSWTTLALIAPGAAPVSPPTNQPMVAPVSMPVAPSPAITKKLSVAKIKIRVNQIELVPKA